MLIYKNLYQNINITSLYNFTFHLYFLIISLLLDYGYWSTIIFIFYFLIFGNKILNYVIAIKKSYKIRNKFIKLIKKYHQKIRLERKKQTKYNIIKKISQDITNQVIEDSINNLNLLEHKELMKQIFENVNQFKLFKDFFMDFKLIIVNYKNVDLKFLNELSEFCKIHKKDLVLISQNNPFKILSKIQDKYFNLDNIYTPYHYNKTFFGTIYKKEIELIEIESSSVYVSDIYLFNQIIQDKKTDECVYFGNKLANELSKKNIMAFNVEKLDNTSFIDILEDWVQFE